MPLGVAEEVVLPRACEPELGDGVVGHAYRTAQAAIFFQLGVELEPLVGELDRLDRDLVLRGVQLGDLDSRDPGLP